MKNILLILLMTTSMQAYSQQFPIIEVNAEIKAIDNEKFIIYRLHNPSKQNVYFIPSSLAPHGMYDIKSDQGINNCLPKVRRKPYTMQDTTTILPQQTINQTFSLTKLFACRKNLNSTYRIYYAEIEPSFNYSKEFHQKYYGENYEKFVNDFYSHIDFKF